MTPRRWFDKLMTRSDKVLSGFYSVEKDKGEVAAERNPENFLRVPQYFDGVDLQERFLY
ncbi:MAG: hypothetical protein ACPH03_04205 [Flavobacteriaceae bacterium]